MKEALDRLSGKIAWLWWLKDHVHELAGMATCHVRIVSSQKNGNASVFSVWFRRPYRLAESLDEIAGTLTPDTALSDPRARTAGHGVARLRRDSLLHN